MMLMTRYVISLGLALMALAPMTARPARILHGDWVSNHKSRPYSWAEIDRLNHWHSPRYWVSSNGFRQNGSFWTEAFGWFCYTTFVDPGPILTNRGRAIMYPVSEKLHDYFRILTAACENEQRFGNAVRALFENIDVFARSAPMPALSLAEPQPLSEVERARLLGIATSMRQVIASDTANAETKAAAHLILALTEGNDLPKDTVNTQELMRLPILYPDQRLTGFLSQYYLYHALRRRGKETEARRVAEHAVEKYSSYQPLGDLEAWKELQRLATHHDFGRTPTAP